jgi:gliding motility-associated-like protein
MKNSISNLFFSQVRLKPVFFLASMLLIFLFSNEAAAQVKTPLNYTNTPQIASCANIPTSIELVKFDKDLTYFQSGGISILIKPTGVFEIDNQFILELSNQSGDFTNSTVLVTRTDFFLPALNGIIPATTTPGTAYKLRVRSTNPARELVTGPFSITNGVSGSKSPSLAYSTLAPSNLDEFIKCVDSENNFFGLINKDINDLTPGGGGSQRINFFLSDFDDQSSTTEVWFINEAGVEEILTISPAGQVSIPSNKPVGYYLISIRKKYGSKYLTSSFIFLYNTGNTGLANTSNENVCVDNAVNFVVDAPAMSKNYPGSLYSINHGDGSPTKYYTHARLMSCSALSNIYRKTSCSDTENRSINEDAYYFRTDLKLFNKGIFDGNVDQCNAFLENGQGTTKWINVSKSPIAQFDVPTQVCAGNSILADEYSLAGQWGDEFTCNTNFNVSWEVLYPGTTDYEEIQPNSSWVTPSRDLLIPGTVTSSRPGCWKIRLSVSNPSGCTQATFIEKTVAVEKQPIPTFTLAPSSQVCKGAKIAFTNTSNTLTAPLECQTPTYQWIVTPVAGTGALANGYAFADNTTPASINPFIQFNEPGGYDVILKITNICGTRESPVRRIDVLGTPSVEFQPDELTVCTLDDNILSPGAGYDLDFSAEPQKPEFGTFPFAPGTYLWEVFDADGTTQTAASKFEFANSTTATSPLPTIRFKAFGTYKIKVTANTSCGSGNDIFTFTLKQEPEITNTDLLQSICSGDFTQEVNFTSNMAGSTFSWTVAPVIGLSGYIPSGSGPKIASTSITNSTTAPLELVYKVTATNNGCQSQEIPIKITVNPPPQVNTITNQTLCVGSSSVPITFSSANSGGTITYVWENNNPAIGLAASSSGNSTGIPSFTIASNDSNQAITATITVTPTFTKDAVSCTGNPKTFTITVNPKPEIANQTITTCSDSPLTGFVLGNDSDDGPIAATYNVTALNLNNLTVSAGAATVANGLSASALADDAFTNTTSAPVDVIYTIVPVSAPGCLGNPFTVTVTVNPEPVVTNQTVVACSGAPFTGFALANDSSGPNVASYNITAINLNGLTPSAGNPKVETGLSANALADDAFTNNTKAPVNVVYTIVPVGDNGCLGNSFTVTATINPKPIGISTTPVICSDQAFNFNPQDNVNATGGNSLVSTFSWQITGITGIISGVALNDQGTGNVTGKITNSSTSNATVQYTVTPTYGNGCVGEAFKITLTIEPMPIVANQSLTICGNSAVGLVLGNDGDGPNVASYNIIDIQSNGLIPGSGNVGVKNSVSQNAIATDIWSNPTNSPKTVIYTIVPLTATGCQGDSFTVTLSITEEPVVTNQIVVACSDSPFTGFALANDSSGPNVASYNITAINLNGLTPSAGNPKVETGLSAAALADDAFTNNTKAPVNVVYTIVPVGDNGCLGNSFTVTATINPKPIGISTTPVICSDQAFNFNPQDNVNATGGNSLVSTFSWQITGITGIISGVALNDQGTGNVTGKITNSSTSNATVQYTVTPTSGNGCVGEAFKITLTIEPMPIVANQSLTICGNSAVGLVLGNDGDGPNVASYNIIDIQSNGLIPGSGNVGVKNSVSQNAIATDIWSNTTNSPKTVIYTIVPLTATGCQGDSFTVTLSIIEQPVVTNQIVVACSDSPFTGFALANDSSGPNVASYNITAINLNGLTPSAGNPKVETGLSATALADDAFTNNTNAPVNVVYTIVPVGDNGCLGNSFTVTATINPEPVVAIHAKTVCSDAPLGISFNPSTSVAVLNYNITAINLNGLTVSAGNPIAGTGLAANVITDDAFTNITSNPVDVIYTVVPVSAAGCQGNPFILTVTVNPEPVVANQTLAVCSDAPLAVNFNSSSSVATNAYNVTALTLNNLTVSAGAAAVANGLSASALADDAFTNTTSAPVDVIYTIVPVSAAGCLGNPFTVTVTVNPEPVVVNQTVVACSGAPFTGFVLGNNNSGPNVASYNITAINLNGLTPSAGNPKVETGLSANALADDAFTNNTKAPVNVVYTIVPVGDNGCLGNSFTVTATINPKPIGISTTPVICSDQAFNFNPQDNVNAIGGNSLVSTFSWQITGITGIISGVALNDQGTGNVTGTITNSSTSNATVQYTVTPTSGNGCVGEAFKITLTIEPMPIVANQTITTCSDSPLTGFVLGNDSDGPIAATYNVTALNLNNLTVSAGAAAVANGLNASALADDAFTNITSAPVDVIYTIVPVSAAGCLGNPFTVTVTVKPQIVINGEPHDYNGFGISCFGADDGYIELTPNGGKLSTDPAGYTFSWTGPNEFTSTAQNIYGLAPGTYTVTVGTGNCTQSKTFIVTEPSPIVIAETISNFKGFEISCFGASDGRIVLAITGGSSTYTYLWTGSNGGVIPAGMQTAANLTDVPAGTYTVNVTDSNGCEKIETYTLRQPAPMTLSEVVANRRNIFCYGEATGNIRLLGSGGVKEYTFTLTGTDFTGAAVSLNSGLTNANLYDFGNLKAGQYLISLQDLNGCVNSLTTIILTQPSAPLQITNLVLSDFNGFNISCFGDTNGSISHQVIGGTPFSGPAPYRYAWTGPNGFSSTSLNLSNLTSGTYTVTITDAANCALVKTYEITSPEPIEVDAVKQNVLCGGENNGNIFIRNITGGTGTYQFVWIKDGVGEIKRSLVPEDLRNISPGRYVLVVTDENFCEYREVFTITEPVPLVTTLVKKENNLCFGDAKGVIQINVAGGTAPYRYTWSGPGGYTSTNKDLTGLLSGTYDVLVTDKQLCTSRLSVTITEPAEIIVTPTLTMVSCHEGNDGSISMNVSGGIPPYVYTWSGPNGFSSSTRDLSNLEVGSYDLVITDNIGCRITRTFEITDPEPIVITPTISDFNGFEISCKGGSDGVISLQITGGNGGYKIFWEGPGGFRSNLQKIEELLPGIYEVTVADSKNCIAKASYELIAPDELLIIKEDIEITDVSCFDSRDGALKVTIKKASVGPYRYELSGITITGFPLLESVLSKNLSYQFTGIQAGSYTLRVSDANGCALSELSGLIVDQPDAALSYTIQKTDATCYRANNGSIRVTPAGGTAPYTIRWNNLSTSFTLQNLSPGTYTATITDTKGCTIAINTEIKEAPIFDLTETVKNISCFGKNDGSIQLNIIGGKGPLTIQWAHGPQEPVLNNLGKGIYHVVITDASGCKIEREFVINEPQPLDLSATVNDALDCVDPNSGSILISPFGGTSPYTYNWSNGAKTQNLIGVAPGSYSLELVDAMGCRILRQFTVIRPLPLEVSVVRTSERVCNPRGLKSNFKAAVTGGIAPYTVTWNRGTVTNAGLTMDTQELGVFIVTVTDAYGCIQTKRIEVIETDPIVPEFDYSSASFDFTYENLVNFEVKFTNTSTGKDKEVIWDFGDGTVSSEWDPTYKYAKPGTYTITLSLKDVDGCVVSFSREIVITDFFFEVPNVFTPNDDGINDHFYPKFLFIKDIHVLIMNKWGELLYESKDLEAKGWDGKYSKGDATVGNYVYRVKYTTLDGRVYDQSSVFYLRK